MKAEIKGEITEFGFDWGPSKVSRLFSDAAKGWVTIGIKTPKGDIQVNVSKTGKIRVHDDTGTEWKPERRTVQVELDDTIAALGLSVKEKSE